MERPGYGRLTLWGGSREVFVVTEPPVGLEVALKEVDADLDTLRLDSLDNYAVVPALLLLLTGDQERAEHALSLADGYDAGAEIRHKGPPQLQPYRPRCHRHERASFAEIRLQFRWRLPGGRRIPE